jgi:hypothetical protein
VDQIPRAADDRRNRKRQPRGNQKSTPEFSGHAHFENSENLRLPGYARYTLPDQEDPIQPTCAFVTQTLLQWDVGHLREQIVPTLAELIHDAMTVNPRWLAQERASQLIMLKHQHLLACAITRLRDETATLSALELDPSSRVSSPPWGWISRGIREQDIWLVFSSSQ